MNSDQASLIQDINKLVDLEIKGNPVSYNKDRAYQAYERIGFEGLRWSVEKRIREYGLQSFMNQENTVLDIGSNFGFFTVEFALYCKLVHGIEPNPWLNKIGEKAAEYLGVLDKVDFFNEKFDDFKIPGCVNGYDVILSLAAFFTQDGRERTDAGKYFRKVNSLLSTNGDFFYESTSYTQSAEDPHFVAKNAAISSIKIEMSPLKIWETQSGSEGYFRSFVIAKKSL